ncbi:hypothetical protein [Kitasatospora sp. NPDC001095]
MAGMFGVFERGVRAHLGTGGAQGCHGLTGVEEEVVGLAGERQIGGAGDRREPVVGQQPALPVGGVFQAGGGDAVLGMADDVDGGAVADAGFS